MRVQEWLTKHAQARMSQWRCVVVLPLAAIAPGAGEAVPAAEVLAIAIGIAAWCDGK